MKIEKLTRARLRNTHSKYRPPKNTTFSSPTSSNGQSMRRQLGTGSSTLSAETLIQPLSAVEVCHVVEGAISPTGTTPALNPTETV